MHANNPETIYSAGSGEKHFLPMRECADVSRRCAWHNVSCDCSWRKIHFGSTDGATANAGVENAGVAAMERQFQYKGQ